MSRLSDLSALEAILDEYCDPRLGRLEGRKPGHSRGWRDEQSFRRELLPGDRDWAGEVRSELGRHPEGLGGLKVRIPMARPRGDGPYGFGSRYWADTDAEVFLMLRGAGAELSFPSPYHGKYFDDDLRHFFLFCSSGVAEPLLEDHGASVERAFAGGCGITELLDSGNAHAYRWLAEHRPEDVRPSKYELAHLVGTPLFLPMLEDRRDGSLGAGGLYDALDRLLGSGDFEVALVLFRKLRFTEARLRELSRRCDELGVRSREGSEGLVRALDSRLASTESERTGKKGAAKGRLSWTKKRVREFQELVERRDYEGMEDYLRGVGDGRLPGGRTGADGKRLRDDPRVSLAIECVRDVDLRLYRWLRARGLDLNEDYPSGWTVLDLGWASSKGPFRRREEDYARFDGDSAKGRVPTRAFLRELAADGFRFSSSSTSDSKAVLSCFAGDAELFDELSAAGMPFSVGREGRVTDEWDGLADPEWLNAELLEAAFGRGVACEGSWASAAYVLAHAPGPVRPNRATWKLVFDSLSVAGLSTEVFRV